MKILRLIFCRPYFLLFLSAVLSALPLTFPSLFLLSWFSFVPFFLVAIRKRGEGNALSAFGRGVFFGFIYYAFVYYWFLWLYPLDFAGMGNLTSLFIVLLAWLGISLLHGLLFAIPTLLCHFAGKLTGKKPILLFTAILGILLAEWIPSLSELAFPWVRLSLGHYRVPALIQLASVFGITGVDLLLLSFSALLTLVLLSETWKRRGAFALAALALFVCNLTFGMICLSSEEKGEELSASLIQGCVLSGEKWSGQSALNTYTSLTEGITDSDLVVWPESAVPVNLATNSDMLSEFQALSARIDTPIFMGCFWKLEGDTSNSAILLDGTSVSAPYAKRHLVPFGECMPYRAVLSAVLPVLEEINMLSSDLAQGTETAIIETEKGKLGSIICFESLFPELTLDSVRDGAELIVLVTNDSWYKDSPGVWQHLAHAVFRSVETSRSTVRCANSGVSAFIDEKGNILSYLGPLEKGILTDTVTFSDETTPYTLWGDVLLPFCALLWIILLGADFYCERRGRDARQERTFDH